MKMKRPHESTAPADETQPVQRSPERMLLTLGSIAAILFLAEFAIMALLPMLGVEGLAENALDSALLAPLVLPALYAVGFRPAPPATVRNLRRLERRTAILPCLQVVGMVTVYSLLVSARATGVPVVDPAGRQRAFAAVETAEQRASGLGSSNHRAATTR